MIEQAALLDLLREAEDLKLLTKAEVAGVNVVMQPCFAFADALKLADSLHLNVKVDNVNCVGEDFIQRKAGKRENAKDGYVKYAFPGGVNLILSAIPISQDDLIEATQAHKRSKPFLDHLGIDLRQETIPVRNLFDAIPYLASRAGWPSASQGAPGKPVFCCHVQVAAKHWVYPSGALATPLEFALGPLVIDQSKSGCDLRPARPVDGQVSVASCCGS